MFCRAIFFLTLLLPFFINTIEAATLHAILVGDTNEACEAQGVECSLDLMTRKLKKIASICGLAQDIALFEGNHVTKKNVETYLESIHSRRPFLPLFCSSRLPR